MKKPGDKYKFILKAGSFLKDALYRLFQVILKTERKPTIWCNSTLLQLFKGRGSKNVLDNMRHIHTKDEVPKFFGQVVMIAAKDTQYKQYE